MRFFGLYFSFFAFLFSYLASQNLNTAIVFGLDVMFWYFAVMSIFAAFSIAVVYLLIKKGVSLFNVSPFFKGLFEGASAFFILNFVVNRLCLVLGAGMLSKAFAVQPSDMFGAAFGAAFLFFGYFVFRPFNFDFLFAKKQDNRKYENQNGFYTNDGFKNTNEDVIDVEIIEDYEKIGDKK